MNTEHAVFSAGLAAEGGVGGVFQGGQVAVFRWRALWLGVSTGDTAHMYAPMGFS